MANQQDVISNDLVVRGNISCQSITIPTNTIVDASVSAGAAIASTKLQHRRNFTIELFGPTTSVAAKTQWAAFIRGATGTIVAMDAAIAVVATGADRTIAVDLQKSTGAGAFATVLSATANFTNVSAVRTAVAGTVTSAGLVTGDILELIVTVAGAAGAQATGLTVRLVFDEAAA